MRSSDFLFHLIKSLTKGDRRNFKLFAKLQEGDKKYVQLFDAIDSQDRYDEREILKIFEGERFTKQFSVAKNYLYNYILKILHIFHKDQRSDLNSHLHQIRILMEKNLYDQAHKLIRKAKHLAERQEHFQEMIMLLQYEREVLIQTQHIKEFELYIKEVQDQMQVTQAKLNNYLEYFPLQDRIFMLLKKSNVARIPDEMKALDEILSHPLLSDENQALSVLAKIKMNYILNDCYRFKDDYGKCLQYSERIIELFDENPELTKQNNILYLTMLHNIGICYYVQGQPNEAAESLTRLKNAKVYSTQEDLRVFESYNLMMLALCIEKADFNLGTQVISEIEARIDYMKGKIRKSKELLFYYAIAQIYIMGGQAGKALPWINKILNEPKMEVRTDLQCMARILNLIVHFELGNFDLLEYYLKSTYRFISNRDRMYGFERCSLKHLKQLLNAQNPADTRKIFAGFQQELNEILEDRFEKKGLALFQMDVYIQSKLDSVTMADILNPQKEALLKGF